MASGGVLGAVRGEIAQERVAGAERQKAERGAATRDGFGKQSVDNLKRSAIAAHGQELSLAFGIGLAVG